MNITSHSALIHVSAQRDLRVLMVSPLMLGVFADCILMYFVPSARSSRTSHWTPVQQLRRHSRGSPAGSQGGMDGAPHGPAVTSVCPLHALLQVPHLTHLAYFILLSQLEAVYSNPSAIAPPQTKQTKRGPSAGQRGCKSQKDGKKPSGQSQTLVEDALGPSMEKKTSVGGACANGAMVPLWKGAVTQRLVRSSLSADQA